MSSNSRHHRTQPRWSRPRLALALTAISVSLYGLSAWQISRDPDVTNINLLVFVLAQPTCALLSALTLLGPAQRRFAKTLYRPLAALTAKLMRIHVLLQLLVALVALQNLGATASAKRRRRRQQQHVQNAHAHAHDSDVGSLYAQTQFYALFAAQIAVPIAAALALQYIVARELGLFVATAEQNELLAKSSSISAGLAPLSASAHNEARATARGSHATTLPWSSSSPKAHPRGRRLSHSLFSSPSPSPPSPSTSSSSTSRSPASVSRSRRIEDDLSPSGVRSHRRHHRAHHSVCLPLGLVHLGSAGGAGGTTARAEAPADGLLLTSSAPAPAPTTLTNAVA
ncbi:hypothetical protein V8E36_002545 [Tilletia maclaganii]